MPHTNEELPANEDKISSKLAEELRSNIDLATLTDIYERQGLIGIQKLFAEREQAVREVCICSAVLINGEIFRGHRHGQALEVMREILNWRMTGKDMITYLMQHEAEQGFITSKNRFVGRGEGRKLQDLAGIKSADKDGYRENTLFSEDLY